MGQLHPTVVRTACEADFSLHTGDSINELGRVVVWPLPETAMSLSTTWYVTASWVPYHIPVHTYVIRSSPLCGGKVLHPAQIIHNSIASRGDRQRQNKQTKTVPWLSSSRIERRVLQRRRHRTRTKPIKIFWVKNIEGAGYTRYHAWPWS